VGLAEQVAVVADPDAFGASVVDFSHSQGLPAGFQHHHVARFHVHRRFLMI
jgi:hypothetical protein